MVRNVFAILIVPWVWFAFAVPGNQLVFLVYPEALEGQNPLGSWVGDLSPVFRQCSCIGATTNPDRRTFSPEPGTSCSHTTKATTPGSNHTNSAIGILRTDSLAGFNTAPPPRPPSSPSTAA